MASTRATEQGAMTFGVADDRRQEDQDVNRDIANRVSSTGKVTGKEPGTKDSTMYNFKQLQAMGAMFNKMVSLPNLRFDSEKLLQIGVSESMLFAAMNSDAAPNGGAVKHASTAMMFPIYIGNNQSCWAVDRIIPSPLVTYAPAIVLVGMAANLDANSMQAAQKLQSMAVSTASMSQLQTEMRNWSKLTGCDVAQANQNADATGYAFSILARAFYHNSSERYVYSKNGPVKLGDAEYSTKDTYCAQPFAMYASDKYNFLTPAPQTMGDTEATHAPGELLLHKAFAKLSRASVGFVRVKVTGLSTGPTNTVPTYTMTEHPHGNWTEDTSPVNMMSDKDSPEETDEVYTLFKDAKGQVWHAIQVKYVMSRPNRKADREAHEHDRNAYFVGGASHLAESIEFLIGKSRASNSFLPGLPGYINRHSAPSLNDGRALRLCVQPGTPYASNLAFSKATIADAMHAMLRGYGLPGEAVSRAAVILSEVSSSCMVLDKNNGSIAPQRLSVTLPPVTVAGVQNSMFMNSFGVQPINCTGMAYTMVTAINAAGLVNSLGCTLWSTQKHAKSGVPIEPHQSVYAFSELCAGNVRTPAYQPKNVMSHTPLSGSEYRIAQMALGVMAKNNKGDQEQFEPFIQHSGAAQTRYFSHRTVIGSKTELQRGQVTSDQMLTGRHSEQLRWAGASARVSYMTVPHEGTIGKIATPAVGSIMPITNIDNVVDRTHVSELGTTAVAGISDQQSHVHLRTTVMVRESCTAESTLQNYWMVPEGTPMAMNDTVNSGTDGSTVQALSAAVLLAKYCGGAKITVPVSRHQMPTVEMTGPWPLIAVRMLVQHFADIDVSCLNPRPCRSTVSTSPEAMRRALTTDAMRTMLTVVKKTRIAPPDTDNVVSHTLSRQASVDLVTYKRGNVHTSNILKGAVDKTAEPPILFGASEHMAVANPHTKEAADVYLDGRDDDAVDGISVTREDVKLGVSVTADAEHATVRTALRDRLRINRKAGAVSLSGFRAGRKPLVERLPPRDKELPQHVATTSASTTFKPKIVVVSEPDKMLLDAMAKNVPAQYFATVVDMLLPENDAMLASEWNATRMRSDATTTKVQAAGKFSGDDLAAVFATISTGAYFGVKSLDDMLECGVKVNWRKATIQLLEYLLTEGTSFNMDAMILALRNELSCDETPTNDLADLSPLIFWLCNAGTNMQEVALSRLIQIEEVAPPPMADVELFMYIDPVDGPVDHGSEVAELLATWNKFIAPLKDTENGTLVVRKTIANPMQNPVMISLWPGLRVGTTMIPFTWLLEGDFKMSKDMTQAVKNVKRHTSLLVNDDTMPDTLTIKGALGNSSMTYPYDRQTPAMARVLSLKGKDRNLANQELSACILMQALYTGRTPRFRDAADTTETDRHDRMEIMIAMARNVVQAGSSELRTTVDALVDAI